MKSLSEYTHAAPASWGEELKEKVSQIRQAGFKVLSARSRKAAVPNCYFGAWKVLAPVWELNERGEFELVEARLETRTLGATIPGRIVVAGAVKTPAGFRCLRRTDDYTELRF